MIESREMATPPTRRTQQETINALVRTLNAEGEAIQNLKLHFDVLTERVAALEAILKPADVRES